MNVLLFSGSLYLSILSSDGDERCEQWSFYNLMIEVGSIEEDVNNWNRARVMRQRKEHIQVVSNICKKRKEKIKEFGENILCFSLAVDELNCTVQICIYGINSMYGNC